MPEEVKDANGAAGSGWAAVSRPRQWATEPVRGNPSVGHQINHRGAGGERQHRTLEKRSIRENGIHPPIIGGRGR